MLKHLRSFVQEEITGRYREMTLLRSDSYLYLMSTTTTNVEGLWLGEIGLCEKPSLIKLFKALQGRMQDLPMKPFHFEAPISHGGTVERISANGQLRKEICSDIESVTLYFHGHHMLGSFLHDLESALPWAA